MADVRTAATIGERIAAARKARGFKAAKDLADAVPNDTVTESILQNIEAGRKTDLAVSQLLNIAWALDISPTFLLVPLGTPRSHPDLPNLTEDLAALTIGEFDAWIASLPDGLYNPRRVPARHERYELEALRELLMETRELNRLKAIVELEENVLSPSSEEAFRRNSTRTRIETSQARVQQIEAYLASSGWDLSAQATGDDL